MPEIVVEGVPVSFPYEPYDCQLQFLGTLLKSLQEGGNALLESPTGTGKTLCLLCGVLGWRSTLQARLQLQKINNPHLHPSSPPLNPNHKNANGQRDSSNAATSSIFDSLGRAIGTKSQPDTSSFLDVPTIYYASRTHSQLSQVVRELRKTTYRPKICVLGSREQTCIHGEVGKIHSQSVQNAMCRKLVIGKQCQFYKNLTSAHSTANVASSRSEDLMDLEDLVRYGKGHQVCPYYWSRESLASADIVFLPYNYLFCSANRHSQGINLGNAIVIVDEAHNLEGHCSEASSVDFSLHTLGECAKEAGKLVALSKTSAYNGTFAAEHFTLLREVIEKAISAFDSVPLGPTHSSASFPGSFVFQLMGQIGLDREKSDALGRVIEEGISNYSTANPTLNCHLDVFGRFLKNVWKEDSIADDNETNQSGQRQVRYEGENSKYFRLFVQADGKKGRNIGYWCMNPGIVMRELVYSAKVRVFVILFWNFPQNILEKINLNILFFSLTYL